MPLRRARSVLLALAASTALALSGCGNKEDFITLGETEGIYVTVGGLKYQVQISRILNPAEQEDADYLLGLPEGEEPTAEQVWFAVFMRVENDSGEVHEAAEEFEIEDTQENVFEPVEISRDENVFVYEARELAPNQKLPLVGTAADENTIRGGMLLFKIDTQALYNRPLELRIADPSGEGEGVIDLDI